MSQQISDLARRFENLLALGRVAEVDGQRVRLEIAGRPTGWLPVPADIGANYRRWRPLRVGTQVLAGCPSGDPAQAVIIQILYTDALPPPSDAATLDVIEFNDGARVAYDSAAHKLTATTPGDIDARADGNVSVTAGQSVTIEGGPLVKIAAANVQIVASQGGAGAAQMQGSFALVGDLSVNGDITATGTIIDAGGNSNHHNH